MDLKCQYENFEEERKRLNKFDFILFQFYGITSGGEGEIHIEHIFIGHSIPKLGTAHRPFDPAFIHGGNLCEFSKSFICQVQ